MRNDTKATRVARLVPLLVLTGLAGCFSLGRVEPPQQHYVLGGSRTGEGLEPSAALAGVGIGVRRLRLASYLEPPFLVVREGPHRIRYAEFHRWGERLGGGIERALAGYLSARAPFRSVDVAPWPAGESYDYLIQIHVERFEGLTSEDPGTAEGEVHVLASWEIIRQQDETVLARGTTDYRRPGWTPGDHAGLVSLLDAGIEVLSADLAAGLEKLVALKADDGGGGA